MLTVTRNIYVSKSKYLKANKYVNTGKYRKKYTLYEKERCIDFKWLDKNKKIIVSFLVHICWMDIFISISSVFIFKQV